MMVDMPKAKRHKPAHRKVHHTVILSIGIGLSIIAFWRGAWGLMDLYVFPNNPILSYVASLVIGFVILYSTNYLVSGLM